MDPPGEIAAKPRIGDYYQPPAECDWWDIRDGLDDAGIEYGICLVLLPGGRHSIHVVDDFHGKMSWVFDPATGMQLDKRR